MRWSYCSLALSRHWYDLPPPTPPTRPPTPICHITCISTRPLIAKLDVQKQLYKAPCSTSMKYFYFAILISLFQSYIWKNLLHILQLKWTMVHNSLHRGTDAQLVLYDTQLALELVNIHVAALKYNKNYKQRISHKSDLTKMEGTLLIAYLDVFHWIKKWYFDWSLTVVHSKVIEEKGHHRVKETGAHLNIKMSSYL